MDWINIEYCVEIDAESIFVFRILINTCLERLNLNQIDAQGDLLLDHVLFVKGMFANRGIPRTLR